jgi:hypothetical protein
MTKTMFLSTDPFLDVQDVSKGVHVKFDRARYETDDADEIEFLKSLPYFGVTIVEESGEVADHIQKAVDAANRGATIIAESVTTGSKGSSVTIKGRVPVGVETSIPAEGDAVSPVPVYEDDEEAEAAEPVGENSRSKKSRTPHKGDAED